MNKKNYTFTLTIILIINLKFEQYESMLCKRNDLNCLWYKLIFYRKIKNSICKIRNYMISFLSAIKWKIIAHLSNGIMSNIEVAECFKVDQEDKKQAIQNAA